MLRRISYTRLSTAWDRAINTSHWIPIGYRGCSWKTLLTRFHHAASKMAKPTDQYSCILLLNTIWLWPYERMVSVTCKDSWSLRKIILYISLNDLLLIISRARYIMLEPILLWSQSTLPSLNDAPNKRKSRCSDEHDQSNTLSKRHYNDHCALVRVILSSLYTNTKNIPTVKWNKNAFL